MVLGALGSAVAIALLGFWFFQNRPPQPGELLESQRSSLPVTQLPSSNLKAVDLKTANTSTVTVAAIEQFGQNNLAAAVPAVEELLNRGALQQAKGALDTVSRQQIDDAAISFLRGRLAWQSIQTGNKDYSLDDARRFWEVAVKKQPKSIAYLNALGFAYYAEGNFKRANEVLFDALYLTGENKPNQNTLTTYAGLALGLKELAKTQPDDKRTKLLDESKKLRQKVMTDDPVNFQPEALSKNWLWSEKIIQDWQKAIKS